MAFVFQTQQVVKPVKGSMKSRVVLLLLVAGFLVIGLLPVYAAGCGEPGAPACIPDIIGIIQKIISFLAPAAAIAFLVMLIFGGFKYVTSGGDPKQTASARSTLTYAIIGIILVVVSWLILTLIGFFTGIDITGGGGLPGPGGGTPACTLSPGSVAAGNTVNVTSLNGLTGEIRISGAFWNPVTQPSILLGNLTSNINQTVTIPSSFTSGTYVIRVGGFGVGCTPNLQVSAAPVPGCSLNPASINAGGNITVNSINGLTGQINMQGAFSTTVIPLGTLVVPSTTVTIPASTAGGTYVVRVGSFGVGCGNLQVIASLVDTDKDGFPDTVETYMGTDPTKACSLPGNINAWPPDFNNDGVVGFADQLLLAQHYNTKVGDANYNKRFDLDADGKIGFSDLAIFGTYYNKTCTPGT